jgi:hypothetical protein
MNCVYSDSCAYEVITVILVFILMMELVVIIVVLLVVASVVVPKACNVFFLLLYSPILGLGRLHETFRFISVTRSRTVGRTPWTGDRLVARPLLTAPGDCDDGEVDGMNGFGRGNRSTRREPAPTPLCPQQIPLARPGREHGPPRWEASD